MGGLQRSFILGIDYFISCCSIPIKIVISVGQYLD
ncbi:uncharacterized protein J3R85_016830 [Psidium guajava]|nr:uncharacterized protein J3R85_016830 [Psidium guajava]